jgi:ribosomal protein S18 acetylase RimI-like enzyme
MNISDNLVLVSRLDPTWDQIIKMDSNYFPCPWTKDDWDKLAPERDFVFSFNHFGELIGFCLISFLSGDNVAHLQKICLDPKARGQGKAMTHLLQIKDFLKNKGCESIFLEVEVTNLQALSFYKKAGFLPLRLIRNFYSDGGDAQTMSLTL